MKVLAAILAYPGDVALQDIQRGLLSKATFDYRFFAGNANSVSQDVVSLGVSDSFLALPFKMQAVCRWAVERDYDFILKMDTDTYLRPERLLTSGFEKYDYVGFFPYEPGPGAYASGGSGYVLSSKAMRFVAGSNAFFMDTPGFMEASTHGEDLQVCWILRDHGIHCHKDGRYCLRSPGPLPGNNLITLHDVTIQNKRVRLESAHQAWIAAGGAR